MVCKVACLLGILLLCVATQAELLDFGGNDLLGAYALSGLSRPFYGGGYNGMSYPGAMGGFPYYGMPNFGGYQPPVAPYMPFAMGRK